MKIKYQKQIDTKEFLIGFMFDTVCGNNPVQVRV